jgi:threonyl-tRNA synthetase
VQVALVPISERHNTYGEQVTEQLKAAGLRVELDSRNEKMNAKIRDLTMQKIPYILVFGDKEQSAGAVSVRVRGKGRPGLHASRRVHRQGRGSGPRQVSRIVTSFVRTDATRYLQQD